MSETDARPQRRILSYLGKVARLILLAVIYALVVWYGIATTANLNTPPIPTKIAIALIALGVTGSTYKILTKVAGEATGGIMVLAEFLNNKLLEPQKRRLRAEGHTAGRVEGHTAGRAEGYAEGRDETLALVRTNLLEKGINPDDIIPPEATDDADHR